MARAGQGGAQAQATHLAARPYYRLSSSEQQRVPDVVSEVRIGVIKAEPEDAGLFPLGAWAGFQLFYGLAGSAYETLSQPMYDTTRQDRGHQQVSVVGERTALLLSELDMPGHSPSVAGGLPGRDQPKADRLGGRSPGG
jgi:hypothetical protein